MLKKILIVFGIVLAAAAAGFIGLVIYAYFHPEFGLKEPGAAEQPKTESKTAEKPTPCLFTRDPVETWPDETVSDPPIGNVELIKKFRSETYDVFGSNVVEARDSMNENGPIAIKEKFPAFKKPTDKLVALGGGTIGNKWYRKNTTNGCIFTGAEVTINIALLLPKWADEASASDQDQKMWDLFLKFAKRHEQGHINIALKFAREWQAEFSQIKSAPSCQELDDKIKALSAAVRQKLGEATDNYDERTGHGATQQPNLFTCNWRELKL